MIFYIPRNRTKFTIRSMHQFQPISFDFLLNHHQAPKEQQQIHYIYPMLPTLNANTFIEEFERIYQQKQFPRILVIPCLSNHQHKHIQPSWVKDRRQMWIHNSSKSSFTTSTHKLCQIPPQ